jgi:hypothetical protein
MKARVVLGRAAIAFGLLALEGCVNTPEGWRILSPMRPPHTAVERWRPPEHETEPPPQTETVEVRPRRHYVERRVTSPKRKIPAPTPAVQAAPQPVPVQPSPAPTLTLADANASRAQVLQTLNQASAKLSKINRAKLDGNNAVTYDQAAGFLRQARKAADQNDYVAASGLARKASILADKLGPAQ